MEIMIMDVGFIVIAPLIVIAIWAFRHGLFIDELDGHREAQPPPGGAGARNWAG